MKISAYRIIEEWITVNYAKFGSCFSYKIDNCDSSLSFLLILLTSRRRVWNCLLNCENFNRTVCQRLANSRKKTKVDSLWKYSINVNRDEPKKGISFVSSVLLLTNLLPIQTGKNVYSGRDVIFKKETTKDTTLSFLCYCTFLKI